MTEQFGNEPARRQRTDARVRRRTRAEASAARRSLASDLAAASASSATAPEPVHSAPPHLTASQRAPGVRGLEHSGFPGGDGLDTEPADVRDDTEAPEHHNASLVLDPAPEQQCTEPDPGEPRAIEEPGAPRLRDAADLPPTLSVAEAGEWLGISRNTAFKLASSGAFPVRTIRIGAQRRVVTAELLTLLGIPLTR